MKEDLTYIVVVLDRSGSMRGVKADTIGGVNGFIEKQKTAPGQALFTLIQFASAPETTVNGMPIKDVALLTDTTYQPTGSSTSLYDAIGMTIDSVGAKLAALPESERPGKVLVMIQTDGCENSSHLYSRNRVAEMIKHQRDKYDWDFVFVGASEIAVRDAVALGIPKDWTEQYAATPAGTAGMLRGASANAVNYRSLKSGETKTNGFFAP